jgi:hypothetical protein
MSVFISYKHVDRTLAFQINQRLNDSGIKTYLDVLDSESQSTENITEVITKNIAECTHLIAIVSGQTASSWWVPFEIGEATISAKRIASFRSGYTPLPEYLDMWPQMTNIQHLALFIAEYKGERKLATENRNIFESKGSVGTRSASDFHSNLKTKIRRGY